MEFHVIDRKTGKTADTYNIALKEEWAKHLIYCDMEGFFIGEDGTLLLTDECGHCTYPDPDRFEIIWDEYPEDWVKDSAIELQAKINNELKAENAKLKLEAFWAEKTLQIIKDIIESPAQIQEDVMRYKMICEVIEKRGQFKNETD